MPLPVRPRPSLRVPAVRVGRRALVRLALAGLLAAGGWEAARVFFGANRHAVVPGRVYRMAQPSGADLRAAAAAHGIRTVVNLRGTAATLDDPKDAWYAAEVRASHALGLSQEDVTLSARLLPPPVELRRLVEVFDRTEYPVLIHCKQGADRTGLASAVYLLLYTDATPGRARRELWPLRGHVRFGPTAAMDEFFDLYEAWLAGRSETHSPARFREWVLTVYTPGVARSELAWETPVPARVPAGRPFAATLRATNRSAAAWELKPGDLAGVHLLYRVYHERLGHVYAGRAGLFRATVSPGEAVEFRLVVPALAAPGRYVLEAELMDARGAAVPVRANSFVKLNDEAVMAGFGVE